MAANTTTSTTDILRYEGETIPHGYGTEYYKDKSSYEGYFVNGVRHGFGFSKTPNGDEFGTFWNYGNIKENSPISYKFASGHTIKFIYDELTNICNTTDQKIELYTSPYDLSGTTFLYGKIVEDDGEYSGSFNTKLQKHGFGIKEYKDGSKYQGLWSNNKSNGFGTLEKNGRIYVGNWNNGLRNGRGTQLWKNGNKYTGHFNQDKVNHYGKMEYVNDDQYEGNWMKGKWDGFGKIQYNNGDAYTGMFKKDQYHGVGTYTFADGKKDTGIYKNNVMETPKRKHQYKEDDTDVEELTNEHSLPPKKRKIVFVE